MPTISRFARSAGRGDPCRAPLACRCTNDSASTPPPGRVSTSTIHAKKSTSWPGRFNKSGKFSEDGPEDGPLGRLRPRDPLSRRNALGQNFRLVRESVGLSARLLDPVDFLAGQLLQVHHLPECRLVRILDDDLPADARLIVREEDLLGSSSRWLCIFCILSCRLLLPRRIQAPSLQQSENPGGDRWFRAVVGETARQAPVKYSTSVRPGRARSSRSAKLIPRSIGVRRRHFPARPR